MPTDKPNKLAGGGGIPRRVYNGNRMSRVIAVRSRYLRAIEPVVVVRLQFTTNRPRRSSKYNAALSVGNPMNENDGAAKPHDRGTAYNQDY